MDALRWVPATLEECADIPGALLVGRDVDGSPIYAGRAHYEGDLIPAKVIPSKGGAFIPYGSVEIGVGDFELLVKNNIRWVWSGNGEVPPGAYVAGHTVDGEPLYLGRVHRNGAIIPGKIQPSHGSCYFPFNGQEVASRDYEVLVID